MARRDLRAVGLGRPAAHGRARSAARAASRTLSPARCLRPEPLHRGVHGAHDHRAARLRRPAVAPARRPPRRAGAPGLAGLAAGLGGGVRARADLAGRRHQRGGGRLDARRAAACCSSTSRSSGRCAGATPAASCCAMGVLAIARVAVVDRARCSCTSRYGVDFLQFTEQPGTIWATNSAAEALRLMALLDVATSGSGYGGTRVRSSPTAATLLFNPLVVGASLLVPALALAGFAWTRRWRYGAVLPAARCSSGMVDRGRPVSRRGRRRGTAMVSIYHNVSVAELHADDAQGGAARRDRASRACSASAPQLAFARLRGLARRRRPRRRWSRPARRSRS